MIVGHSLQAKCDVANAFIKQNNAFKQFKCRQNLLIKRIVGNRAAPTVAGRPINVVLTPNLNSPGWTHLNNGIFSRFTNKIFVYVKAPSEVNVDDDESVRNIKAKFKGCTVKVLRYFSNVTELDRSESDNMCLYKQMPLHEKRSTLNTVLTLLGKAFRKDSVVDSTGNNEVDSFSSEPTRKRSDSTSTESSGDDKTLESVPKFGMFYYKITSFYQKYFEG